MEEEEEEEMSRHCGSNARAHVGGSETADTHFSKASRRPQQVPAQLPINGLPYFPGPADSEVRRAERAR